MDVLSLETHKTEFNQLFTTPQGKGLKCTYSCAPPSHLQCPWKDY
jgi:hypothetical protein